MAISVTSLGTAKDKATSKYLSVISASVSAGEWLIICGAADAYNTLDVSENNTVDPDFSNFLPIQWRTYVTNVGNVLSLIRLAYCYVDTTSGSIYLIGSADYAKVGTVYKVTGIDYELPYPTVTPISAISTTPASTTKKYGQLCIFAPCTLNSVKFRLSRDATITGGTAYIRLRSYPDYTLLHTFGSKDIVTELTTTPTDYTFSSSGYTFTSDTPALVTVEFDDLAGTGDFNIGYAVSSIYFLARGSYVSGTWSDTAWTTSSTLLLQTNDGAKIVSPIDQIASATGSSSAFSVGPTGTLAQSAELGVAIAGFEDKPSDQTGTYTTGSTYISGNEQTNGTTGSGDASNIVARSAAEVLSATTAQYAAITMPNSADWAGVIVTFREEVITGTNLTIENSSHVHKSGDAVVTTQIPLVVEGSFHIHKSVDLVLTKSDTLVIGDSFHAHVVADMVLTQVQVLAIEQAIHIHTAEELALTQAQVLAIEHGIHVHKAGELTLGQLHNLQVEFAYHAHRSEDCVLGLIHNLQIENGFHGHTSGELVLSTPIALNIENSSHSNLSENVVLQTNVGTLFNLDHEEGDLSEYNASQTGGGDLAVEAGAALGASNFGMRVLINDYGILWARKDISPPNAMGNLRLRLYFDPNSITLADGTILQILQATNTGGQPIAQVDAFYSVATGYQVRMKYWDNYAASHVTSYGSITDAPHWIEFWLIRDTLAGTITLWIDDVEISSAEEYPNNTRFANFESLWVGALDIPGGTSGTIYIDEIRANDTGAYIGPIHIQTSDSFHVHKADGCNVTTQQSLVIENSSHAHKADDLTLTIAFQLTIENGYHVHPADAVGLTQVHVLDIQGSLHSHSAEDVHLSQIHNLQIENSFHAHTADDCNLTTAGALAIESSFHAHVADETNLTQLHNLIVESSQHVLQSGDVLLTKSDTLVIEASKHGHTASDANLTLVHNLVVEESHHAHRADDLLITKSDTLAIESSKHSHAVGDLVLGQIHNLQIGSSQHAHTCADLTLGQTHNLQIGNGLHVHKANDLTLEQTHVLQIGNGLHAHQASDLVLGQIHVLVIENSSHSHVATNCEVSALLLLAIEDSRHSHTAEEVIALDVYLPASDTSLGSWTDQDGGATDIYLAINEIIPDNDNYVQSPTLPAANTYKFKFQSASDPSDHTHHYIALRVKVTAGTRSLAIRLKEGITTRASWSVDPTPDWMDVVKEITQAEAASITDYSNLFLELEAS